MEIGGFNYVDLNLTVGDMPERIAGAVIAPSVFAVLGIQPSHGRVFAPDELGEGHDDVVVISERLWKRRFNSDPQLIGKQLSLNGRNCTVVGLMPEQFQFPVPIFNLQGGTFGQKVDIWKPLAFTKNDLESRGSRSWGVIGRLKSGITLARAQAELDTIISNWYPRFPDNYEPATKFGATLYGLHNQVVGSMRVALLILLGAVAVVLLIACANLTTMLLARAGAREREFAIRVALGARTARLLRQTLTESVLLAVLGGGAGAILAVWGLDLLRTLGSQTVPRIAEANLDLRVLLVTLAASVGTGIIIGLVPAIASAKPELTEALKEGGRGSTIGARRNRLRNLLVIAEVALALVLLAGGTLLLKSFVRLQNVDPGFDPGNVLTMEVSLPLAKYPRGKPVADVYAGMIRRVQSLPGVEAAALTSILPLSGTNSDSSFAIEGRDQMQEKVYPDEEIRVVTPDYFKVLKVPVKVGRFFEQGDAADAPQTVIVNQGDMRHRGLDVEAKPEYYLPHLQRPFRGMIVAMRSKLDPRSLAATVRREIRDLDPELPAANVRTMENVAADSIAPRKLSVVLIGIFAALALVLASVGIYGVMSFLVVQRTHEIGVRMALGAQRRDVLLLVVGRAARLVLTGTVIGLLLAFLSTRTLGALLYNVGAFDVPSFTFATLVLALVALTASYVPARRVTRADPMIALAHTA
ncbi:MAG: hypothetical protein DME52_13860 [Verrucomicrobia bacterium]|nr:MAG: hypothetical protein DME52_13860 [Verrucomicrobiota bacterium]